MLRNNRKTNQIPANHCIADNNSANHLHPDDFSEFNQKYSINPFPNNSKWIGFTPNNKKMLESVRQRNKNTWTGYKIHIVIPKNNDYKTHLNEIIKILSDYGFHFKIDAALSKEKLGERAFTVYLPHKFHAHWFKAFKLIENYLANQLGNNETSNSEYSLDGTAKTLAGFKYILYRNDRGPDGSYTRNLFNKKCECSLKNPFRPRVISLLNQIYSHDTSLYHLIAHHIQHDTAYCEFLIYLQQKNNEKDFLNSLRTLTKNNYLRTVISSLCWHDLTHNETNGFAIAESLVKDKKNRDTIFNELGRSSSCPAYHVANKKLTEYNKQQIQPRLKKELSNIGKTIEAVTVKGLHTKLIEDSPYSEYTAKQKICDEIDIRLCSNDKLTKGKSAIKCLKNALLNILYIVPIIGWIAGAHHYVKTGSFFQSLRKKSDSHKKIENDLMVVTSFNNVLNA